MDGAERLLESGGAHQGGRHHMRARLEILPVRDGADEALLDEPHALDGDAVRERVIGRAAIGLEAMRERVHAGAGRDRRAACRS